MDNQEPNSPANEPISPAPEQGLSPEKQKESQNFAMFCHLSALAGFIIPFGNVIGPLIFWLIKKDEFPYVDQQGKEALNFQITVLIAAIISSILTLIFIGILMLLALAIGALVLIILASLAASKGEAYRYPFTIRFIK